MVNIYIINIDFENSYELKDEYPIIFSDLESAQNELKEIYKKTPDFKYYGFEINVYILKNTKYIKTNEKYTYCFDKFTKH